MASSVASSDAGSRSGSLLSYQLALLVLMSLTFFIQERILHPKGCVRGCQLDVDLQHLVPTGRYRNQKATLSPKLDYNEP